MSLIVGNKYNICFGGDLDVGYDNSFFGLAELISDVPENFGENGDTDLHFKFLLDDGSKTYFPIKSIIDSWQSEIISG